MNIQTLWDGKKAHLPPKLIEIYIKKLKHIGMFEYASSHIRKEDKEGPVGGESEEETHKHFAERFSNSSIRLQYVLIDPNDKFGSVPENFFSTFSEGNIALLDAPCGTGAGALSLLYTLAELRKNKKLPTLPLNVTILASDYSESALELYAELLDEAIPFLWNEKILVTYETIKWDAFSIPSTHILMTKFTSTQCDEFFVIVSAFSGINSEQLERLSSSLQHMQGCLSPEKFTMVHIEPATKKGNKLFIIVKKILRLLQLERYHKEFIVKERFSWLDPVNNREPRSSVMVSLNSRDEF